MLGSKPGLASNNSIQVHCYDCLDRSSGDMTSKGEVMYDPSVMSIRQSYISGLGLRQGAVSQTQRG